jgi:uncharacterized protein YqeY
MALFDTINEGIKSAMKAREQLRLETLRFIKKELLEARSAKNSGGVVSEEDEIKILKKMLKQRRDASTIYAAQSRADLADKEDREAEIIAAYLPEQMSDAELEQVVKGIITSSGATSIKEMGKVMGLASSALAGKAEGSEISKMVKKLLS